MKAAGVKGGCTENENGGVDEEGKEQRHGRIDYGVFDGFTTTDIVLPKGAGLHNARVQVEIVRHHRGADDANSDIKHFLVAENLEARDETMGRFEPQRSGDENFIDEANGDRADQSDDEGLD